MNRQIFKRAFLKLCMIFLGLSGGIGLTEIAARIFIIYKNKDPSAFFEQYCDIHSFRSEPDLGFELKPLQKEVNNPRLGTMFSTNSLALRGNQEFEEKKVDEFRLAFLGGSCVFGFGAKNDEETLAPLLENHLKESFPENSIEVINGGHPGYTSYQMLERFKLRVQKLSPDVAIIYSGWNDIFLHNHFKEIDTTRYYHRNLKTLGWQGFIEYCNRNYESQWLRYFALPYIVRRFSDKLKLGLFENTIARPSEPLTSERQHIIVSQYKKNINNLIEICLENGTTPIVVSLFSEYLVSNNTHKSMLSYLLLYEGINKAIEDISNTYKIPWIPANKTVEERQLTEINNTIDKYHLSYKGNLFLSNLIHDEIMKLKLVK